MTTITEDTDTESDIWRFKLYVAGQSAKSVSAFQNLQQLCEKHLPAKYVIDVIDLLTHPSMAREDQIVAIPTMIKLAPSPICRIVGDLSNTNDVLARLRLSTGEGAAEEDEKPPPQD